MRRLARLLAAAGAVVVAACSHLQPYPNVDVPQISTSSTLRARLILVGDAGWPDPAVLAAVRAWSGKAPARTAVVYLGDNVYEDGLPPGPALDAKAVLDQQIAAVGVAHGIFVPGNHDWHGGRAGIVRQAEYVEARSAAVHFRPRDGCPGPDVDATLDGIRLIAFDTEWLLQRVPDGSGCELGNEPMAVIGARVTQALEEAGHDLVVVVAHHPPRTYGAHGGFFDWRDHVFPLTRVARWAWIPLPVIGSLYPLARKARAHDQDAYSEHYRSTHDRLGAAFAGYRGDAPLIFAGGHDHGLQVLGDVGPWDYVVVSGSGSLGKLTAVTHGPETVFAHLARGFVTLDLYSDSGLLLRVIEAGEAAVTFAGWLRRE